jgi:hypothetical protein
MDYLVTSAVPITPSGRPSAPGEVARGLDPVSAAPHVESGDLVALDAPPAGELAPAVEPPAVAPAGQEPVADPPPPKPARKTPAVKRARTTPAKPKDQS